VVHSWSPRDSAPAVAVPLFAAATAASLSTTRLRNAGVARLCTKPFLVERFVGAVETAAQHLRNHGIEKQPPLEVVLPQKNSVAGHVGEPLVEDADVEVVLDIVERNRRIELGRGGATELHSIELRRDRIEGEELGIGIEPLATLLLHWGRQVRDRVVGFVEIGDSLDRAVLL